MKWFYAIRGLHRRTFYPRGPWWMKFSNVTTLYQALNRCTFAEAFAYNEAYQKQKLERWLSGK